jgi:hypothetical protein
MERLALHTESDGDLIGQEESGERIRKCFEASRKIQSYRSILRVKDPLCKEFESHDFEIAKWKFDFVHPDTF